MKTTNKELKLGNLSQETLVEPFRVVANSLKKSVLDDMRCLTSKQAEYILWMYDRRKIEDAVINKWTFCMDMFVMIFWFPLGLIFRRDAPSFLRIFYWAERREKQTEIGRLAWVNQLSDTERKQAEEIHRYWQLDIDAHLHHHLLGWNKSLPVATAEEVENEFLELLRTKVKK